jgi:hypothetical protein
VSRAARGHMRVRLEESQSEVRIGAKQRTISRDLERITANVRNCRQIS